MSARYFFPIVVAAAFVFTFFFSSSAEIYARENLIYGHISLVDKEAFVLKSGEDRALKAEVNLPLVPGDIIYTESGGRCEIQFDNGTIIRLDKNTELKFDTILSKSITTKDMLTILQFKKGHIITMNQVYKNEIFQVITPTAAIKMIKRSTNYLQVNQDGSTRGFVERGKVGVLYGKNRKSGKKQFIGAGKGFLVTKNQNFKPDKMGKDIEFMAWNNYINKKFKELHSGNNNIPAVIYRRSPGIVHFAENWSSKFGVWEYNELFGYVWQPYDEIFHGKRPFWDANYVRINGELVLVPNQPWGWAPAHLGTWFFSKTYGWLWIPGDAFSPGICSIGLLPFGCDVFGCCFGFGHRAFTFNSLGYWVNNMFGNKYLYLIYRTQGRKVWSAAYAKEFNCKKAPRKPFLDGIPDNIKDVIAKMNKAPVETIEKNVLFKTSKLALKIDNSKIVKDTNFDKTKSYYLARGNATITSKENLEFDDLISHKGYDWNPDSRWASKVGVTILYSSKENAVICPKLKISSRDINDFQRNLLRRSVVDRSYLNFGGIGYGGISGNSTGSTSAYYSSGSSGNSGAGKVVGGSSSGGGTDASAVEK